MQQPQQGLTQASVGQTHPPDRIVLLDGLRAVALLGIFLVNIEWFTRPWQSFGSGVLPGLSGLDLAAAWTVHVFVAGKFWILFSLLFGMGFAVMAARVDAQGGFAPRYLRRLAFLLVIGLAHALLQWVGDILHTYAVAGLLLLCLVRLQPLTQLVLGLTLYGGLCLLMLLGAVFMWLVPDAAGSLQAAAADNLRAGVQASAIYANGTFSQVTAQRAADLATLAPNNLMVVPMALGVFLIGSWLLRSGRMRDAVAHRGFFVRLALGCLPVGLAITLLAAWLGTSFPAGAQDGRDMLAMTLQMLGALPLSLGYLALMVLAWQVPSGQRVLKALAPAGRMALTLYLMQSLLASLAFYGYGLALWGRVSPAGLLAFAVAVFAVQVLLARWWLARFRYGPVEWLWRWVTYARRPDMRAG